MPQYVLFPSDTMAIDVEDKVYLLLDGEPEQDEVLVLDSDLNELDTIEGDRDLKGIVAE